MAEIKSRIPVLLRSSIIGSVIGAMPGLGASPAAYMAYSEAQRTSKHPEQFGKGAHPKASWPPKPPTTP